MFVLPTLITGLLASYVQSAFHPSLHHRASTRVVTNINNITDFGSCDDQCRALVTKNQACDWQGGLNDAMGLACICTNDHIDSMATCIDCMDKISSGANVSVFLITLERVVQSCNLVNRPVNTPTLIMPKFTVQSTPASSGGTIGSTTITPSATVGLTSLTSSSLSGAPSPTAGSNGTSTTPNGAAGISATRGAMAGILNIVILVLCEAAYY